MENSPAEFWGGGGGAVGAARQSEGACKHNEREPGIFPRPSYETKRYEKEGPSGQGA
jgi:hypothetical protein